MKQTLFEESVDDVFLKSLAQEQRPPTNKKHLASYFEICSSSVNKKYFKYYFELHDNYVFCKKSE